MPFPFDGEQTIGILSNVTGRIGGTTLPFVPPQDKQSLTDGIAERSFVFRLWKPDWPEYGVLGGGLGPGIQDYSYHTYDYVPPFEFGNNNGPGERRHGGGGGTGTYPPGDDQAERKSFKGKYFKDVVEDITHSDPDDPCNDANRANFFTGGGADKNLNDYYELIHNTLNIPPEGVNKEEWQRKRDTFALIISGLAEALNAFLPGTGVGTDMWLMSLDVSKVRDQYQQALLSDLLEIHKRIDRILLSLEIAKQYKTFFDYDLNKFTYPCPLDEQVEEELIRNMELLIETYNTLIRTYYAYSESKGFK